MDLPVNPPLAPMLAKATDTIPEGRPDEWWFEPKWDGFRCIVFRDDDELLLASRTTKSLTRYFPELVGPLDAALPRRCVIDGEIVVATANGLDFGALQQRIHPAESRINRLSVETPAQFIAFDLLALDDRDLLGRPLRDRRRLLEENLRPSGSVLLTPGTSDRSVAVDWFDRFEGAGLEGVMAKRADDPYRPDVRAQLKVKHLRSADCVVAGFREHKSGDGPGSLLLGLFDDEGRLHHVGVASSFSAARRAELREFLAPYIDPDPTDHPWASRIEASGADAPVDAEGVRLPGAPSRWTGGKDLSFTPLRLELVAEVAYERVDEGRFRHGARLLRWRLDRDPRSATFAQLEVVPPIELSHAFDPDRRG